MTINRIPYFDPFSFSKTAVGFDDMLKKLSDLSENLPKIPTYPPYNIKKIDDTKYVIEMAVAGFGKQDLELVLPKNWPRSPQAVPPYSSSRSRQRLRACSRWEPTSLPNSKKFRSPSTTTGYRRP